MCDFYAGTGGGLYIHIAYCRQKCIYCDFFSAGERIADWHGYVDALIAELTERKNEIPCPLLTIYVGGGTPSLMPADEFIRLSEALQPYAENVAEFTIEVNPDDVCDQKLSAWKAAGVNRLSIGIQTFEDSLLRTIGRRHDASSARRAVELARKYFDNISIDLMFGLPGQTLDIWSRDIDEAIRMKPQHISAYALMFEPGTALTLLRDKGLIKEADEGLTEKMYLMLAKRLKEAGFEHYEISNFALPAFRSRHNSSYWVQAPYMGIGPSAHSYDGMKLRRANNTDLRAYLTGHTSEGREYSLFTSETLTEEQLRDEYIMTRMRTCSGIPVDDFKLRFGEEALADLLAKCKSPSLLDKLNISDSAISLREDAFLLSDSIILEMVI